MREWAFTPLSRPRVSLWPADNHLFMPGSGKPGPEEYQVPGHVDPRVIERLVTFVSTDR